MVKRIFIAPIFGIELTEHVNNEFQILRTLLVSNEKLRRNRKKFGLSEQISKLTKYQRENLFDSSDTFAIVPHNDGKDDSILVNESLRIIQKELSLISLSRLQHIPRGETINPTVMNPSILLTNRYALTKVDGGNLDGKTCIGGTRGPHISLSLDKRWKTFQKENFFFNLLKLIRRENKNLHIKMSWIEDICRASILIGKSQCSNDLEHAFLWNMIALEVLITKDDNKFLDILPKRIEAFLGWLSDWHTDNFAKKIEEVYRKRSDFVHQAKGEKITTEDLLFTDLLLFNILYNITSFPNLFREKGDLIAFSDKLEAQKTLKIKRKPIGLKFRKITRDIEDVKKFFNQ